MKKNFRKEVLVIQNTLKSWRVINLTIDGEIEVLKTLVLSKAVYLALFKKVLNLFVNELIKIHSNFFWKNILPKIKLKTFLLDQNHGG